ncbi:MAG: phosphomethylpyrimidine synthase ThiC [Actinobacteria bacterium]|nr:MAG: phosphomethylpyrimidine synthase ThiC [Actinomycetota bacterium]
MTLIQKIKSGKIPESVKKVALAESIDAELLAYKISTGNIAIVQNKKRKHIQPVGIGEGLKTKVNANIGTSENQDDTKFELDKLRLCEQVKADTVMDLSTGRYLIETRKKILEKSSIPVGTVPIYQCAVKSKEKNQDILSMTTEDMFKAVEGQAEEGVDFMTIHCGINRKSVAALHRSERVMDVVSRGGAFTIGWMIKHDKENPFFESFDRLLDIAKKYEITLSLGDGMRPGAIADASDEAQFSELSVLAELVRQSREASVQVIVEGPGHMPLDQITTNVKIQKQLTDGAPFYVLGPLVTDIAPGYDHITGAIGGAIAASVGADFLCYVTPQEHLGLPQLSDVKEGIIASRIAAHAADIVKKVPKAKEADLEMSKARKELDWKTQEKISLDPEKIQKQSKKKPANLDACTMCGSLCSMKLISQYLGNENVDQCV